MVARFGNDDLTLNSPAGDGDGRHHGQLSESCAEATDHPLQPIFWIEI